MMMDTTIRRTLRWGKGYAGKLGKRCWIARITGTDTKYGLGREFLDAETVQREHFNRARTIINFTYNLSVGLYELCEESARWFVVVWRAKDGSLKAFRAQEDRVNAMANLLQRDREINIDASDEAMAAAFEDIRRATKPAPKAQEIIDGQTT
jgi:hypothetical protein